MKPVRESLNNFLYGNKVITALRIIMGILFIYSGIFKAYDPLNFSRVIYLYDISPEILVPYGAIIFPIVEITIGLLLLLGYKIKSSSLIAVLLMIFWTTVISINVYRGNSFDCGCFELNKFGIKEEIGIPLIIRDIIFLIILYLILQAREHILSIDNLLEKKRLSQV